MSLFDVDEFLLVRRKSPRNNELIWISRYLKLQLYKTWVKIKSYWIKTKTNTHPEMSKRIFEGWINTEISLLQTSLLRGFEMLSVDPVITYIF